MATKALFPLAAARATLVGDLPRRAPQVRGGELVPAQSLTPAALETWLARYKEAWELRDPARAAALFTEHAPYHEMPFDAPKAGRTGIRDYWTTVTADQRNIAFTSKVVAVEGRTGIARWSATLTSASSGAQVALDGVFILEFDGGLCSELREWWHVRVSQ